MDYTKQKQRVQSDEVAIARWQHADVGGRQMARRGAEALNGSTMHEAHGPNAEAHRETQGKAR